MNLLTAAKELNNILSYPRRADSAKEKEFIVDFILPLNPVVYTSPYGKVLAYVVEVGESKTLFSSHIDTCHFTNNIQYPYFDSSLLLIMKSSGDQECLGADDGAGMWIMFKMIAAGIPGTYIFHRDEEVGGVGSGGMALFHKDFLSKFDRAIAFDRMGTSDVIIEQLGSRCCSDEFADALCYRLNRFGFDFSPKEGIFTDTARYTEIIPECTNISCGYYNEHTKDEFLDVDFVYSLMVACLNLNWESLPSKI